jgi:phage N-6-adenine-methyltransferase
MIMPSQGLDLLEGVYQTPINILIPIDRRWPIGFDLAANDANNVVKRLTGEKFAYYAEHEDALKSPWTNKGNEFIPANKFCWLNPPFENIGAWTKKACEESKAGAKFVMLIPSATGAKWLVDCTRDLKIVFLIGRPIFEFINPMDHKNPDKRGKPNTDPYGKDMLLVVSDGTRGVEWWDWRK